MLFPQQLIDAGLFIPADLHPFPMKSGKLLVPAPGVMATHLPNAKGYASYDDVYFPLEGNVYPSYNKVTREIHEYQWDAEKGILRWYENGGTPEHRKRSRNYGSWYEISIKGTPVPGYQDWSTDDYFEWEHKSLTQSA